MPATTPPIDYQAVFHQLPENFLLIGADPDATILDNTDSHVVVSLKSREEAVGRPFFEAYPAGSEAGADEIRASHAYVRQHLAPHTMPLIRYDLTGPDGQAEELYWQATHYPVLNEQGTLQYILQRTQNVTEQLRVQQAAAEAQRLLNDEQARNRFILESLPVLVWSATPDGQRDYFNRRWIDFTGRPLAAELGLGWLEDLHEDDRERVHARWQAAVASGEPYQVEYRLRRHDGQYRYVLSRATAQRGPDGEVRLWVGGVVDVHDERQLVQELMESTEHQAIESEQAYANFKLVQQRQQMFYHMLLHAPAYVAVTRGPEHRYDFVNEKFMELTGGEPVVGRTVAEVFPEGVEQGIVAVFDQVLRDGHPYYGTERPMQLRLHDADGRLHQKYFTYFYDCYEEDGQRAGVVVFGYDVTELVQTRQRLNEVLAGQ